MDSGSVQAYFFLSSIKPDCMHVRYALDDGFLNPFVHLVFILIEPITAKDVATSKRWWGRSPNVFSDCWFVRTLGIPPGSIENIRRSRVPILGKVGDGGHKGIRQMRRKKLPNAGYIRFPAPA